jgi:hypothetical protein
VPEKKEPLSKEEREARKRKQDALKRAAIQRKSRQVNAAFRIIAVLGLVSALLAFSGDFYAHKEYTRSGWQAVQDVLTTGRAYVKVSAQEAAALQTTELFQKKKAGIGQHFVALMPFILAAFLVMYIVDFAAPLGSSLHAFAALFCAGAMTYLLFITGALVQTDMWPGVTGGPVAREMMALFVTFLGSLAATPGSGKRLAQLAGETGGASSHPDSEGCMEIKSENPDASGGEGSPPAA